MPRHLISYGLSAVQSSTDVRSALRSSVLLIVDWNDMVWLGLVTVWKVVQGLVSCGYGVEWFN